MQATLTPAPSPSASAPSLPTGLGTNAIFRLNNRRIKLYSSISWGFWGLNGLFPTPELAEKEVTQAKKLNLNCLNFHRNLAKEEVLRAHDRLGLLRYMEPGAGKMAIGKLPANVAGERSQPIVMEKPTDAADKFAQRFMFVKCVEMVKAYRSHPSVIIYCLQNEIGADLKNPDTIAILAAMRAEDPSRCIVLNDGFVAPPRKAAQAWFEPWNDKLHRSDEKEWGDWWNQHQGAGDQWYDEFYKSPTDFTYRAPYQKVLTEFGEMEGCATPDNHALMVHQITETYLMYGGNSYDLTDHKEILAAYDKFLDRWKFRSAFPTAEHLFNALGKKCYDTWAELPRKRPHLRRARLRRHLRLGVHRHRKPLRHRRQSPQLQIRPHTHQRHPHTHPPRSQAAQRQRRPRRIRHLRPLPPQRHAATRHRHSHLHRRHAFKQTSQTRRTSSTASRTRSVQLSPQRSLSNSTPHRRRSLPLQVRSQLCTALHTDQRHLGHVRLRGEIQATARGGIGHHYGTAGTASEIWWRHCLRLQNRPEVRRHRLLRPHRTNLRHTDRRRHHRPREPSPPTT